jgi:sulfur-oxidizing protein SoxY
MSDSKQLNMTRRGFVRALGMTGLTAAAAGTGTFGMTGRAEANADIFEAMGSNEVTEGKVSLGTPNVAENASLVKVPVEVDHPQEPGNYIDRVAIVVDNNPIPVVATFDFTPDSGNIQFEVRIKMAKSSPLRVVARTNGGKLYGTMKEIKVAAGGCA